MNRGWILKNVIDNDELLIRYLLGELDEKEQEDVEEQYISNPEFFEELVAVEDDLIDAYAEGGLSQERRARFEDHFLISPERKTRVGFAEAWMNYVSGQSVGAEKPSAVKEKGFLSFLRAAASPSPLLAAAVVLITILAGGLTLEILRLRSNIARAELETAALQRQNEDLASQIDEAKNRSLELAGRLENEQTGGGLQKSDRVDQVSSEIVSFFLVPGLVRGTGDTRKNVIPKGTRMINLNLSFEDRQYESYDVSITTVDGRETWRKSDIKPQSRNGGKSVTVRVPSGSFATNDYIVNLIGTGSNDKIARYFFSVTKK
jgi:hypothetical protein